MPYLPKEDRYDIERIIPHLSAAILAPGTNTPGSLNFAISSLVDEIIEARGESYGLYNAIVGALECSKLEIYRRMVAPYEDKKQKLNGDVFNTALPPGQLTLTDFNF